MNILFGDSFIGPFTLLNVNNLYIKKFKGKTMRGISKLNTDDYIKLYKTINTQKKINGINYVIFMFGQGDILFSIYYEILIKHNYNIKNYLDETLNNYHNFLLSLNNVMNNKKVILSICPLMLSDEETFHSLYHYPILDIDILKNITMTERNIIFSYKFRNTCRKYLNILNKKFCKEYNIKFIDFDDILIDKNTNKPLDILKVKEYDYNIHPYFEIVIFKYLSKLKFLNLNIKFKEDINQSQNNYKNNKIELVKEREKELCNINYYINNIGIINDNLKSLNSQIDIMNNIINNN